MTRESTDAVLPCSLFCSLSMNTDSQIKARISLSCCYCGTTEHALSPKKREFHNSNPSFSAKEKSLKTRSFRAFSILVYTVLPLILPLTDYITDFTVKPHIEIITSRDSHISRLSQVSQFSRIYHHTPYFTHLPDFTLFTYITTYTSIMLSRACLCCHSNPASGRQYLLSFSPRYARTR